MQNICSVHQGEALTKTIFHLKYQIARVKQYLDLYLILAVLQPSDRYVACVVLPVVELLLMLELVVLQA